jgi:hypothetical protein
MRPHNGQYAERVFLFPLTGSFFSRIFPFHAPIELSGEKAKMRQAGPSSWVRAPGTWGLLGISTCR